MRALPLFAATLLLALPALAEEDCDDAFTECQDDCTMQHGTSVRDEQKKAFARCMKKCTKKVNVCRERVMETKTNHLEEGALDKAPGSDEVDEHGMPTRTATPSSKKSDATRATKDDLRDDAVTAPPADDEPKAAKGKGSKAPKEEVRDEEVVKSSRTSLDEPKGKDSKSKTASKAKDEPKPEPKPEVRDEEVRSSRTSLDEPKAKEPAVTKSSKRGDDEPKASKKPKDEDSGPVTVGVKPPPRSEPARGGLDDDMRDDGARGASSSSSASSKKKSSDDESRDEAPKKKSEPAKSKDPAPRKDLGDDDLRNE